MARVSAKAKSKIRAKKARKKKKKLRKKVCRLTVDRVVHGTGQDHSAPHHGRVGQASAYAYPRDQVGASDCPAAVFGGLIAASLG
jgi:hypothetical protein